MHHTQDPGKISLMDGATRSQQALHGQSIPQVAMQVPGTIDFCIGIALALI